MSLTDTQLARITAEARRTHTQQVKWRRHLHQHPELSFHEHATTEYLRRQVTSLGLSEKATTLETGLITQLGGSKAHPAVAIRSDIDALPVTEQTELPFKSRRAGCMHACGHDVHMAIVLGTAAVLARLKSELAGSVRFLFQPAEECPPGGAQLMIKEGALDGVTQILGLHVDPSVPVGSIGLRDGLIMASVLDFDLVIKGKSGHAAHPHESVDAIAVACEVVESLQKVVSREIDPITPVAISFGQIGGGIARNIIAGEVRLVGTARSLSAVSGRRLKGLIKRTAEGIARAHGARVQVNVVGEYPTLANDAGTNRILSENYESLFGKGRIVHSPQSLGGEDFARYLQKVPGAMFRLGIRNPKIKADKPWHSPLFVVDEDCLFYGTALLAAATIDILQRQH